MTRRSVHGVAGLVLAGPRYRAAGKLRLRVVPGGFAAVLTPRLRADGSRAAGGAGARPRSAAVPRAPWARNRGWQRAGPRVPAAGDRGWIPVSCQPWTLARPA
ncbi:hypothetical protein [Trebonia sp.]|uniref:hypothetical protein n=1 Tax=Trebonia sp. TaxID=2767075 RepID=UPI002634E25B|nr:hypothetical protein [Trebonia sp.]